MVRPLVFTDLDDTLFQTAPKCPDGPADALALMSTLADGSPSGFATVRQQGFLDWLRVGEVIPVTARGRDVLARVRIEQAPAICANGGCILNRDAVPDADWHDHLSLRARGDVAVTETYAALTDGLDTDDFRHWVVSEGDLPLYIVIKSNRSDEAMLADLEMRLEGGRPAGWRFHRNGNNLALLPAWLNKRHAVAWLIEKVRSEQPDTPVIGIGDSLSDAGFMDLCDYAMMPTNSQIWQAVRQGSAWIR